VSRSDHGVRPHHAGLRWFALTSTAVLILVASACGGSDTTDAGRTEVSSTTNAPEGVTGQWAAAEATGPSNARETTIVTSPDGREWTDVAVLPGETVSGFAWGDGKWIAVANVDDFDAATRVLESTDLRTWNQVATVRETLVSIAYGGGRWVAVGTDHSGNAIDGAEHSTRVVYTSTDGEQWTSADADDNSEASLQSLVSVAYNDGTWLAIGTDGSGRDPRPAVSTLVAFSSTDGTRWNTTGTRFLIADARAALASSSRTWILSAPPVTMNGIDTSTDGRTWTQTPGTPFDASAATGIAQSGDQLLAVRTATAPTNGDLPSGPSTFFASRNVENWTKVGSVAPAVTAVAFGPATTGKRPIGSTTTTTGPPATSTTTTTALPSTTTTAGPSEALAPACTTSAVLVAIPQGWSYQGTPLCEGPWAVIHPTTPEGDTATLLLRASGGTWVIADGPDCDPAIVPAAIFQACATN
jgi:hypothetical protein